MATKSALNTFHVSGRMTVIVGVEVKAKDWDSALEEAKKLKIQDFVSINGDYEDGTDLEITTIWKNEWR